MPGLQTGVSMFSTSMQGDNSSPATSRIARDTQMKRKDLSDVPPNPPRMAGRSQTPDWVEIIATQALRPAHVGITLGLEASNHQPGWSLWLM